MAGDNPDERQARSLALERAYVHDVYDRIAHHFADTLYRPWPRVRQFLEDLEPGCLVADVGCGNGKYLDINPDVMKIGLDYCATLTAAARTRGGHEVLTCDNLHLPFRDETFDAVLSVAVIHHFATTDRRVAAIKELTRVMRIGGKVLITVWAMEQRHRKFDSQDVLVPWHEPVKSSSEDRGSSVERELTSTTTSDDDVLVYHAYSHISDGEGHPIPHAKKKLRYRNGRGRYRSADHPCPNSSQSSSELSSPNETCYSFVRRAFQKLSNSASTTGPYDSFSRKNNNSRPYFYRSCRKPCISDSMEFGPAYKDSRPSSPRNELHQQDSLESEYPDHENEDDIPIELRHLEGYDTCKNCGSPEYGNYNGSHVCTSCLPITDSDTTSKKTRSLGDFLNMIPKLLRVKKCEKEQLSDLHKRISTASDPREYVVKTRGANVNGIVRSKSTVSFMSRLEELMSMSLSGGKDEQETVANPNCSAGPRSKSKPSRLPSLNSSVLIEGSDGTIAILENDISTNPRRHISPADALRKLRQDVSLDEQGGAEEKDNYDKESDSETKLQNRESPFIDKKKSSILQSQQHSFDENASRVHEEECRSRQLKNEKAEGYLSSYYSMPELYKLTDDQASEDSIFDNQRQKTISFLEHAQNILGDGSSDSNELSSRNDNIPLSYRAMERNCVNIPQRGLVKRSLSVDTGDNCSSYYHVPRRFSASAAQGVLASALRTYTIPRSCSRGSSVKSDTSVDSEESIVSVIPRKGNSITSDTSVDSEESVISVIQRSTSDIDTLGNQNGFRNISRFGSRSAQASPITVLSSQTSSAESSPPQSGKNDGRFPGNAGVIDQLMQQQSLFNPQADSVLCRQDIADHLLRTRRCLLRPISDPRIEEKLNSHIVDDISPSKQATKLSSVEEPKLSRSFELGETNKPPPVEERRVSRSFELGETNNFDIKEQIAKIRRISSNENAKPVVNGLDLNKETEQKDAEGELSRTPSPVGPIRYITDPLITGVDTSKNILSNETQELESKTKCLRFDSEITNMQQKKTSPGSFIPKISSESLQSALKITSKKDVCNGLEKDNETQSNSLDYPNISKSPVPAADISKDSQSSETLEENCSTTPKESSFSKGSDSEVRRSLFKLKERLESLTSSQGSSQSFDLFRNVSHTIQGFGSLKNIKERLDSEANADANKESKVSPTPKSLNDSRQSSLDESSLVTLSDESVMSVEYTSSVSDEANDYRRTDEDDDIDSSQNITVRKATDADRCNPGTSKTSLNSLTDTGQNMSHAKLESIVENGLPTLQRQPKVPSFSDTELHSRKGAVRGSLRKRLRRSCVTIDEVECRDFISSEDTSPSSSVSLEWNDFDKIETDSSSGAAYCSSITTATTTSDMQRDEPSIEICCDDVNVAETETKFNVFGDKEMCVFFETPTSSIGKSASSSSNATDFSTTSDRIRGVMQREKSDDRSSKESDSDNLSKLSDIEAKSDSAFSEDFARKTDIASSSSSASLDILDSMRLRLSGDSEFEVLATKAKQTSNWVLENIDEIPDDEKNNEEIERCTEKSPTPSTSWITEKSTELNQQQDDFLSSAADCRDMYRISFDLRSKGTKDCETSSNATEDSTHSKESVSKEPSTAVASTSKENGTACTSSGSAAAEGGSSSKLNSAVGLRLPELAPEVLELFPRKRRADNEGQTDILAAFVETISDLTAVFHELYPRQENKFEDLSSDESIEISSFERILTSSDPPSAKSKHNVSVEDKEDKESKEKVEKSDKGQEDVKPSNNESAYTTPISNSSISSHSNCKVSNIGQTFVKLPPESDAKQNNKSNDKRKSEDLGRGCLNKPISGKTDKNSTSTGDPSKLSNLKKVPEKLKILNRSSQSVCLERVRQDSFERDDDSLSTHSAPCSPRMKPRQRSVEEVLSSSRTELSRASSLSQSTSQESLPGNEMGGLMACHRYYHVFRQGELDSLIENNVDNLHIISSYYDHANWCVIAEKVQVWTI